MRGLSQISDVLDGAHKSPTPERMNATIAGRTTSGLDGSGPYVHISHGDQKTSHDPHDVASVCTNDDIALFMLAVEPGAFLGCNGWDPQFGKPLGTPKGPMVRNADGTYSRSFQSGTTVSWDPRLEGAKGRIHWAGDPPGPSPPPSPPPSPLPPTKTCPDPASDCSWPHANVGAKRVLGSWSECCDVCSSDHRCAKWVFHSGEVSSSAAEGAGTCVLHGAGATGPVRLGPGSGKVCGRSNASGY